MMFKKAGTTPGWYWVNVHHLSSYGGWFMLTPWFLWTHVLRYNWRRLRRLGVRKFHLRQKPEGG